MGFGWRGTGVVLLNWPDVSLIKEIEMFAGSCSGVLSSCIFFAIYYPLQGGLGKNDTLRDIRHGKGDSSFR